MKIDVSDGEGEDIGIDISPLVDVMFILIIFFLVTTSFHQQQTDMAVNLPETDLTLSSAVQVLVINVREDGSYFVGDRRMDIDGLHEDLMRAVAQNPDQKVLVRADRNALHGQVARALAACRRVGVTEANIGYMTML
ncbi:MAG TPA: biopolymer transporter ExbD [Opitutales bacterium]|nr:biopolymer transporter ExbD [Opitutales bacterium]MDD4350470.1 biopolymer transporter ExbD [Opitutales bacterium]HOO91832.1 biopolymer transporter ExbD [Opitutales bacterium]